jgi:hypothetical protein
MNYGFHKWKVPKGLSYPLKRSVLDKTLENSRTNRIKWVYYSLRTGGSILIEANFVGEAHKLISIGYISLSIYAVLSEERKQTEELLIEQGLPKLVEWLKKVETAGEGWRSKTRLFGIHCKNGKLNFSETI